LDYANKNEHTAIILPKNERDEVWEFRDGIAGNGRDEVWEFRDGIAGNGRDEDEV